MCAFVKLGELYEIFNKIVDVFLDEIIWEGKYICMNFTDFLRRRCVFWKLEFFSDIVSQIQSQAIFQCVNLRVNYINIHIF